MEEEFDKLSEDKQAEANHEEMILEEGREKDWARKKIQVTRKIKQVIIIYEDGSHKGYNLNAFIKRFGGGLK